MRSAVLATFDDEPLASAQGPIGVRLRYRVVYPQGLDLDVDDGAFAQLGTSTSRSAFLMIRRAVAPRVSSRFRPGTYEITEDFVPEFLPPSLINATSEPTASDHCFRWSATMTRQQVLTENAELLAVAVYVSHSAIQRPTTHPYRLADFYATAAREGAVDCAN